MIFVYYIFITIIIIIITILACTVCLWRINVFIPQYRISLASAMEKIFDLLLYNVLLIKIRELKNRQYIDKISIGLQ